VPLSRGNRSLNRQGLQTIVNVALVALWVRCYDSDMGKLADLNRRDELISLPGKPAAPNKSAEQRAAEILRVLKAVSTTVTVTPESTRPSRATSKSRGLRGDRNPSREQIASAKTGVGQNASPDVQGKGELQRSLAELQVEPETFERILGVLSVVLDARASTVEEQKAMMLHGIDPVPSASVAQAQRLARQRERLLASGAYSMKALAALRGDDKLGTTRTWVARKRANQQMITVNYEGEVFAPVFQFTEEGELQSSVGEVLRVLEPVDLGSWATWSWFESASTWLGGQSPKSLLQSELQRVVRAAQRFVSNAGIDASVVG
jgi:hypothetical protein